MVHRARLDYRVRGHILIIYTHVTVVSVVSRDEPLNERKRTQIDATTQTVSRKHASKSPVVYRTRFFFLSGDICCLNPNPVSLLERIGVGIVT